MSGLYGFDEGQVARIAAAVRAYEGSHGRSLFNRTAIREKNYSRIAFRNDNASTAPAYGVLRVTGTTVVDLFPYLTVDKPDSTYRWLYLVNGPEDVVTNGFGWGTWLWHGGPALYDTGSGTPAYGQEWGPTASSWKLQKFAPGFFTFGANDTATSGSEFTHSMQLPPGEILVKNATGGDYAASHGGDTYQVWGGASGSEADTGLTVTAYNKMSIAFKAGKFGSVGRLNGQNYAVTWQT